MNRWSEITKVATAHHGVIGRRQLEQLDVSRPQLATMVRRNQLERVAPRVWRVVGSPTTWHQRLHTGLLTLGPKSWVSHESAAQLHGFDRTPIDRVEFLVLRGARKKCELFEVHSTRRWGPSDAVTVEGLRTTSATRTVLDLANAGAHPDRLAAAIDTAVRLELSSPEALRLRLDVLRTRGWNGVRRIEQLLEHTGGHTMLERRFLELMDQVGLPRPETQIEFRTSDGRFVARVDFYFRAVGVVVEVSGRVGHSSPAERQRDAQRRNELLELGLLVYEFTWEDVTERAFMVAAQMRRVLTGDPAADG